jgi:hypothetical protein
VGHGASDGKPERRRQKSRQYNSKIVLEEMGWMNIKDSSGSRLQQMARTCELGQNTVHLPCITKVKYKLWTLVCGLYYYLIYCQPKQIVTC